MKQHPEYPFLLSFEQLSKEQNIKNYSTTRKGGVSRYPFESFNLGNYSEDDPCCIRENRERLVKALHIRYENLIVPKQIHSDQILIIDKQYLSLNEKKRQEASNGYDALITQQKNISIGITTADCVPIILYDRQKQVTAAIHAGWRGTVKEITRKVVQNLETLFHTNPSDIIAGIGPSISRKYFEVGNEVAKQFVAKQYFQQPIIYENPKTKKAHIDLWEANKQQLMHSGVPEKNIEIAQMCTYTQTETFFSARREGIKSGRMITGIILL